MSQSFAEEAIFGPFRLSLRRRALAAEDGPIPLSSRAFDVLAALMEAREAPISKDALMQRVWGNIFVEENNLHVQIAAIRRALGPDHPYILTIPGRGYRFVADVVWTTPRRDLTADAASAPADEPPGNLPVQVTALIGRREELATALSLLDRTRLVTLVGPGGVGKTKLALAIAQTVAERYPAGAWLLELGALADPALAASALAACLRIEEVQDRPLIDNITAALRPRELLLVIDGCEHVLGACSDLVSELLRQCPRLTILCTSQAPLGVEGEHVRRIAPFDVGAALDVVTPEVALAQDAVRLFAERAGAGDGRFEVTDKTLGSVIEICRDLEGIPLAIELAAARVPLLGLEPVRQRIANRLALLGDDRRGTPDRHRTLRATIEWSHGLLPPSGRELLRRLSVFAGGFTLEAAQQVVARSGLEEWDVVRGVSELVRRSLLTTGPDLIHPRHRMLEAMREFALGALDGADEHDEVARRHADYFRDFAETLEQRWESSGDVDWVATFAPEIENLRAALEWCLGPRGDAVLGARLAAATARFWFEGGHVSEGRTWLTRVLDRAPADLDLVTLIRLKRGLADLTIDAAAATEAAEAAVALAKVLGDGVTLGVCLRMLAATLFRLGRYADAEHVTRRAFELLSEASHPRTFAKCLGDLCVLHGVSGDYEEARRYNALAQARLKALGDRRGAAICLQYAAEFEFAAGDVDAAAALGAESVALLRTLNSRFRLEIGLGNLAAYRLAKDDAHGAAETAREALIMAHEIEDEPGVVIAIEMLALALVGLGVLEAAARLHAYVEAAHKRRGLVRQETEQAIHERLVAALTAALAPQRMKRLAVEGAALTDRAAMLLALEPLAVQPGPSVAAPSGVVRVRADSGRGEPAGSAAAPA